MAGKKKLTNREKIIYICNRCCREIKTEGTRIIPHSLDLATGEMLGKMEIPDDDVHLCLDCTRKLMRETIGNTDPGGKPDGKEQGIGD